MSSEVFISISAIVFIFTFLIMIIPFRFLFRLPIGSARYGEQPLSDKDLKDKVNSAFVKCIEQCNTSIKAVAGECTTKAYTRPVGNALRRAIEERDITVKIICGPIITVRDEDESSPILELAIEGKLQLYFSNKRLPLHFRIGDNGKHLYWEEEHTLNADRREYYEFIGNDFEAKPFLDDFEKLLSSGKYIRSNNPKDDFVLVKESDLSALDDFAAFHHKKTLGKLNASEIRELYSDFKKMKDRLR